MIAYRLARIGIHVMLGMCICALLFPFINPASRQLHVNRWAIRLLSLCGVQVEVISSAPGPTALRALFVSNHVSWLDIFVINSISPCRFVAKSDIRDWPLIGWLSAKAGTIFIARGRLRDVRRIYEGLVISLRAGEHVAFFPEGTTGAQGGLLAFHSNLFEAAVEAKVPVQPYAIRYVDAAGALMAQVDFIGDMSFAQSIVSILQAPGKITAQLIRLPLIDTDGCHRRTLSTAAHGAIAAALAQRPTPVAAQI